MRTYDDGYLFPHQPDDEYGFYSGNGANEANLAQPDPGSLNGGGLGANFRVVMSKFAEPPVSVKNSMVTITPTVEQTVFEALNVTVTAPIVDIYSSLRWTAKTSSPGNIAGVVSPRNVSVK